MPLVDVLVGGQYGSTHPPTKLCQPPPQPPQEIVAHHVGPDRLSVDPQAMIIEPEDIAQEEDLLDTIGSTAQGVGAALAHERLSAGAAK